MTQPDTTQLYDVGEDVVDLSSPLRPKRFILGPGHEVVGPPELSVETMQALLRRRSAFENMLKSEDVDQAIETMYEFFDMVFGQEQSAAHIRGQVGMTMLQRLVTAIVEKYGERPTQPSLPDSGGSSNGGTGKASTDGASNTTSTPETSPPIVS